MNLPKPVVLALAMLCGVSARAQDAARVVAVPAIPDRAPSHAYQVTVNGRAVPVNDEDKFDFHTAMFCMEGAVKVEVQVKGGADGAVVRPTAASTSSTSAPRGGAIELRGFDAGHRVDNVTFENCSIGGDPVDAMNDITVNDFVTNVKFLTSDASQKR